MLTPPVIDLSPLMEDAGKPAGRTTAGDEVVAALHRACTETGFFVVTGHGLDDELADLMAGARAFFDQPQAAKEAVPRIDRYGFIPHSADAIDTDRASDRTEYLDLGLADEIPIPAVPGLDLSSTVRTYQRRSLHIGHVILAALARAVGQPPGFFRSRMSRPQCRLRFLHYPPVEPAADGSLPVPTEPHTDYGLITLLATDGVPGLEVKPHHGSWNPVEAEAGQLVVNLGDMMARWTNDVYRSTPHRVVGPASGDRISIPFFVNPNPDVEVETIDSCITEERPGRYDPVTAGEFLARRIDGFDEPYVDRAEGPVRRIHTDETDHTDRAASATRSPAP